MKIKELIDKYWFFAKSNEWRDALDVTLTIRKFYPDELFGFLHGGICLKELGEYGDAVLLLSAKNDKKCLRELSRIVGRSELSKTQFEFVLGILISEEFDFSSSTYLVDKLYHEKGINSALYTRLYDYLIDNIELLNDYTKAAIGELENPTEFLIKAYESANLDIIKKVLSSHTNHLNNVASLKEVFDDINHNDICIKNTFKSRFSANKIELSKPPPRQLKIAVCVSGQVRGYEKAFKTWKSLFDDSHHFDFYCAFWNEIGRKPITKPHLYRHFNEEFIKIFLSDIDGQNYQVVKQNYSPLFNLFAKSTYLDQEKVANIYSPTRLKVYDTSDFVGKSGMYCMHYMIEQAYLLIPEPEYYDLIVRIRPDKSVESANVCWNTVYENCKQHTLFSNGGYDLVPGVGIIIGDQFAVSIPKVMNIYSKTFSKVGEGRYPYDKFPGYRPHMSLALSLLSEDVNVKSISPTFVRWGKLLDPNKFDNRVVYDAITNCNISATAKALYEKALIS